MRRAMNTDSELFQPLRPAPVNRDDFTQPSMMDGDRPDFWDRVISAFCAMCSAERDALRWGAALSHSELPTGRFPVGIGRSTIPRQRRVLATRAHGMSDGGVWDPGRPRRRLGAPDL